VARKRGPGEITWKCKASGDWERKKGFGVKGRFKRGWESCTDYAAKGEDYCLYMGDKKGS